MNRFVVALAVGALLAGAGSRAQEPVAEQQTGAEQTTAAGEESGFANELEKGSYALGYSFGKGLRDRKVEVATDPLLAGLTDGVNGAEGRLSEVEIAQLTRQIQNAAMRRMQEEREVIVAQNRAAGEAFMAANKDRPGVVSLPSGLQYVIVKEGDGPKPKADETVKVHFRGNLIDGTVVDSSYDRNEPIVIRPDRVIPAWTEALPMMSVGSIWRLFAPSELGYGDDQSSVNIPPGATLIFEVELLSIEPAASEAPEGGETPEGDGGSQG